MNPNLRSFFDIFVEFYTDAGIEKATDELINQYAYKIDHRTIRGWNELVEKSSNDILEESFDSISNDVKVMHNLPTEKIRFKLGVWDVTLKKIINKVKEVAEELTIFCNEETKVCYSCSVLGGGIDVMVYMYKDDIPEGTTIDNNKNYIKAKRIILDFFHYAKQVKSEFDEYQRTIDGQTFEVRRPADIDEDKEGTYIVIDNAEIHGFGKGTDPDTTEFNKVLVRNTFCKVYDREIVTN